MRPIKPTDPKSSHRLISRTSQISQSSFAFRTPSGIVPELLDRLTVVNCVSGFAIVATAVPWTHHSRVPLPFATGTGVAEFAIAVEDDWQGMGLGKENGQKDSLFIAKKNGIRRIGSGREFIE